MNKKLLLFSVLFCLTSILKAQTGIDYVWSKLKCELPPLSPLPAEKTFNTELPNGMTYLSNWDEVRPYWDPYGLILINKWDTKNPSHYKFKLEMPGMKVIKTEVITKSSEKNITGQEHFREYTFTFPARISVIDNSNNQVIKTIDIISDQESFTRKYHRNIFITDSFDPNYKKEVGFDSLRQVTRVAEDNAKVMKKLEGNFASEVFEKMKIALVNLYGKTDLRADFAALNPKSKGRTLDYSDYDAAAQKMKKAIELYNANPNDPASLTMLDEVDIFYSNTASDASKFIDHIPAMVYWNLAEIKLLKGDTKAADEYYTKSKESKWPNNSYLSSMLDPAYLKAKEIFASRSKLK